MVKELGSNKIFHNVFSLGGINYCDTVETPKKPIKIFYLKSICTFSIFLCYYDIIIMFPQTDIIVELLCS